MKFHFYKKIYSFYDYRKYVNHIFFLALLLVGFFFIFSSAKALTVSPVKVEVEGLPGQVVTGELTLLNEQPQPLTFYSSFENFEPQGETGAPNFVAGSEGLATWIKAPLSVTLNSQEKKVIEWSIEIPTNADSGGHFAAIFWSAAPPNSENGERVAVGAKIGTLVLLKVSGDIKEEGVIADFGILDKKTWLDALPIAFTYRFQNSGTDRVKPLGAVTIKNMFGHTSALINANSSEGNVLPGSVRKFSLAWTGNEKSLDTEQVPEIIEPQDNNVSFFAMAKKEWNHFAFGRYTAQLQVNYGSNNEAHASYTFFLIPWQLLSILLALLLVALIIAFIGIKKYNRWIISRAHRHTL